jgi:transketolase
MALAPLVYTLWQHFLRFNPEDPIWPNRDRFVLSNGHASMLLYAMLHLTGVKAVNSNYEQLGKPSVTLDDIKRFRELGSKCPGHPEYHLTSGVETTTGPLGQGCGNSVGIALAGRWLAQHYNRPDFAIFDYDVYAVCGDGDMMEGVSSEAASFAGHRELFEQQDRAYRDEVLPPANRPARQPDCWRSLAILAWRRLWRPCLTSRTAPGR